MLPVIVEQSKIKITPEQAQTIAEGFIRKSFQEPPLPLTFRKMEWVHRKLIYQFQSEPVSNYDGKYHLGPVNFKVERLVLDVDAITGDIYIANGCGAAPGKMVYKYDPTDFDKLVPPGTSQFISNNTNFIARKTGNTLTMDGRITESEWDNTGHKYFYLGTYKPHDPSEAHTEPYYYVEVWSQIDDKNIYFAVKTDTPFWVGLMFKDNPNLGMLGAYRDAKVMRSNGEISDRYFTQRKDKTFYLAQDAQDDILLNGHHQEDYYTYEFAIPLNTGDPKDISFEVGKAYNMLLVAGNTLDHYGIFTMDKAHANHNHSKNNKEHVDVWASNEETIRIGTPPDRDIFGNPADPVFASFESGFDPSKNSNHFHYAGVSLNDFTYRASMADYVIWLTIAIWLAGSGVIMYYLRKPRNNKPEDQSSSGFDLLKINWLRRFVATNYFRYLFIIPTLIVFLIIIFSGFFDVQDGQRNVATVFTWTLWWSLVIFTFIIAGRFWCMMCPFAFLGDLAQKFVSLNKKLPHWLQNMWIQTLGFIVLTWAFTIMTFGSKPFVTAVVIVAILLAAIVFSIIYQRRSFCRHLCPIGAVIGIYSMVSPIELRPCRESRCDSHKQKTCSDVCPMLESPDQMDNNIYCNFCMKCQPSCATHNIGLKLRSFGKDIYASLRKSSTEAIAAMFLLGVVVVETLAMTSAWKPLEDNVRAMAGINSPTLLYTIIFIPVILIPIGVFYLFCYLLKLWLGKEYKTRSLVTEFAFIFIPLGIGLHFAHNIQHLLIESPIAVPAVIRFVQNIGIGTSLTINWNPSPFIRLEPIFFIQMGILITGLSLTIYVMYRLLRRFHSPLNHIYKMTIAMSLYAIVIVLSSIYMLGLPMSARHLH
ncbi:MAG TPA: 4Fe-4S binding protein [Nitrospirae bacterium]|nr:4Fe-4S binding protein [Nitrospirota bacterium]